jgi:hypothetical protein
LGAAIALPVAYYEYYVVSDFEMNVLKKNWNECGTSSKPPP